MLIENHTSAQRTTQSAHKDPRGHSVCQGAPIGTKRGDSPECRLRRTPVRPGESLPPGIETDILGVSEEARTTREFPPLHNGPT